MKDIVKIILMTSGVIFILLLIGCGNNSVNTENKNSSSMAVDNPCNICGKHVNEEHEFYYYDELCHDYCVAEVISNQPNIINMLQDANGEALEHLFSFIDECGYYPSTLYGDFCVDRSTNTIHYTDSYCLNTIDKDYLSSGLEYGSFGCDSKNDFRVFFEEQNQTEFSFCERCCSDNTTGLSYWVIDAGIGAIVYSEEFLSGEMEYDEYSELIWDLYCCLNYIELYDDPENEMYKNDKYVRDLLFDMYLIGVPDEEDDDNEKSRYAIKDDLDALNNIINQYSE